ncbi:hypothetical protein BDQ12DRAFT_86773 [Crucibulum laeve]|uniref:Uncharacterized protein n=1 Tax=Crucibulum laeve TaxID=68775 RepID=A0A5C3M2M2_9AGAR|nr:hypothetical protein BDQ12DRAFT_86773 [Crucibulum laeve]
MATISTLISYLIYMRLYRARVYSNLRALAWIFICSISPLAATELVYFWCSNPFFLLFIFLCWRHPTHLRLVAILACFLLERWTEHS